MNSTLKKLVLCNNFIDDDGVVNIVDFLKVNTSVSELDLGGNRIGDIGATHIALALRENTALNTLDLSSNKIELKGFNSLRLGLKNNTTLTKIKLSVNGFDIDMFNMEDYLDSNEDSETDEDLVDIDHGNTLFTAYLDIRKICNRNKDKELLLKKATPVLKKLSELSPTSLPTEIAELIAQQLVTTEFDAATLRRIGDFVKYDFI